MSRPTFPWRLRSLWGATLAGLGLNRGRSVIRLVQVPPEPWWWRFRHVITPPMPRSTTQPLIQSSRLGPLRSEVRVAASRGRRTTLDDEGLTIYSFERFSERAKDVLTLAQEEAERSRPVTNSCVGR